MTKMHDYHDWRFGIDLDRDADGLPRARVQLFEPGTGPRDHHGMGLGQTFNGSTTEEAERKAIEAAKQWIDRQLPRKKSE